MWSKLGRPFLLLLREIVSLELLACYVLSGRSAYRAAALRLYGWRTMATETLATVQQITTHSPTEAWSTTTTWTRPIVTSYFCPCVSSRADITSWRPTRSAFPRRTSSRGWRWPRGRETTTARTPRKRTARRCRQTRSRWTSGTRVYGIRKTIARVRQRGCILLSLWSYSSLSSVCGTVQASVVEGGA